MNRGIFFFIGKTSFSDGNVKFFQLVVNLVQLRFFGLFIVNLLTDVPHKDIGIGDDVGALFELVGNMPGIVYLLLVFDLVLEARPEIHRYGADLYFRLDPFG